MAHLIVFVLDCMEECPNILDAWEQAGAPGATILESSGVARMKAALRDDLPPLPSLRDLLSSRETHHRTIFTVVEDDDTLERVIVATQATVGDLSKPNTGILFVVPVTRVLGLVKRHAERK